MVTIRIHEPTSYRAVVVPLFLAAAFCCWPLSLPATSFAQVGPTDSLLAQVGQSGDPAAGRQLFDGQKRLAGGGPPCGACHDAGDLPFPHGGSLGLNLTGAYAKYGAAGLQTILATLFFPTMAPVFAIRPLTPSEASDLEAFFQAAGRERPAAALEGTFFLMALGGLLVLLAIAWAWLGTHRLPAVRQSLATRRISGGLL